MLKKVRIAQHVMFFPWIVILIIEVVVFIIFFFHYKVMFASILVMPISLLELCISLWVVYISNSVDMCLILGNVYFKSSDVCFIIRLRIFWVTVWCSKCWLAYSEIWCAVIDEINAWRHICIAYKTLGHLSASQMYAFTAFKCFFQPCQQHTCNLHFVILLSCLWQFFTPKLLCLHPQICSPMETHVGNNNRDVFSCSKLRCSLHSLSTCISIHVVR